MIGKVMKGKTFKGCVEYVLGKEKAVLLDSDGLLTEDIGNIVSGFNTQRLLKPKIKQPVGHISLAYSVNDKSKLTDKIMTQLAQEYMKEMGIQNTQYIIARHFDSEHPHVHIVYNRIDNNGEVISDKNDYFRNERVCKELKRKHNLYFAKGKENVKQHRLKGNDKTKYRIYQAVKNGLNKSINWDEFEKYLKKEGVHLTFKYKGKSDVIQGISFTKDDTTFKGSEVDRNFSYVKLNEQLKNNSQHFKEEQIRQQSTDKEEKMTDSDSTSNSLLMDLLHSQKPEEEPYDPFRYRKKKKKGITR